MRDYGFVEELAFFGLAPKAIEKYSIATVGGELEVMDLAQVWA